MRRGYNTIVGSIVTAIDEQVDHPNEMAENINQASIGIQEATENVARVFTVSSTVTQDIAEVSHSDDSIAQGSVRMKANAAELTEMAKQLKNMVQHFKV